MNFEKSSVEVAQDLLGMKLVHGETSGIIVETEAYPGEKDPACHYSGKSTKRGKIFEKGPGTVYVYNIHGHDCMNFISGSEEYPEGVLIRAVKPIEGIEKMKKRRDRSQNIADGPAKMTEAMNIQRENMNGKSLNETELKLKKGVNPEIVADRRIGISSAESWPLRFCIKDSDYISTPVKEPVQHSEALNYKQENL